jgi:hypothetical protein
MLIIDADRPLRPQGVPGPRLEEDGGRHELRIDLLSIALAAWSSPGPSAITASAQISCPLL